MPTSSTRRDALLAITSVAAGPASAMAQPTAPTEGETLTFATRRAAEAASIPAAVTQIWVDRHSPGAPFCPALYEQGADQGELQPWQLKSSGRRWTLTSHQISPLQFGARYDGSNDTQAWVALFEYARARSGVAVICPPGVSACEPNRLWLAGPGRAAIHGLRIVSGAQVVDAHNVSDSVLDFSRFSGRGRGYPGNPLDWGAYDYGLRGLAGNEGEPEQSGVDGLQIGVTIVPPNRGVGIMISHGRNLDFAALKILSGQRPGEFPQYGVVLDKCIAVRFSRHATIAGTGYHRFGLLLFADAKLDRGPNLYNDSIELDGVQFGGNMFACIADWGSQSEGVRTIRNCLQSGEVYYFYLVGQVPTLVFEANWTERARQVILSIAPEEARPNIPLPNGPPIAGVDRDVRVQEVAPRGVIAGTAEIASNFLAYAQAGFDLSGFRNWEIRKTTLSGGSLSRFAAANSVGSVGMVEPPVTLGAANPDFVLAHSPFGSVGVRGAMGPTWSGVESCWRDDQPMAFSGPAARAGSASVRVRETRFVQFVTDRLAGGRLSNFPVVHLDRAPAGPLRIQFTAGGSEGAPAFYQEMIVAFGTGAGGALSLLGIHKLVDRAFDGEAFRPSTLPWKPGITIGLIGRTREGGVAIFIGAAYPKLASLSGGTLTMEFDGLRSDMGAGPGGNGLYQSRPIIDATTARALITRAGAAGVDFGPA